MYYTPDISEFVQGFKFERLDGIAGEKIGSIMYLNIKYNKSHGKDVYRDEDQWTQFTVFWKREPEMKTILYENGASFTYKEYPEWDWHPWVKEGYIEELIKDGKIRAKKVN